VQQCILTRPMFVGRFLRSCTADRNQIYTVLTVTTGLLRVNNADMALSTVKMSSTPLQCSRMSESQD